MLTAFETRDALMAAAADRLAEALQNGLKTRGRACAALSGGSTPEPAYRLLAEKPLDWANITFALVDERFVDPSDTASNQGMLERVLAPALAQGATLKPMYAAASTVSDAAHGASALYQDLHYDIALMGMGEDGHTASWFPGSDGLDAALSLDTKAPVVAVDAATAAGAPERLTLTRAEIAKADHVLLLITGPAKRAKLEAALKGPDEAAPVAALFRPPLPAPEVFWAP
jgi:6-phosphogluconolactonase